MIGGGAEGGGRGKKQKKLLAINECFSREIVHVHLNMLTYVLSYLLHTECILNECCWFLVLQLDFNADKKKTGERKKREENEVRKNRSE